MSKLALDRVISQFSSAIMSSHAQYGDETIAVKAAALHAVLSFCRDDALLSMDMLMDLTCVDYLGQDERFELVYELYSLGKKHRLRVKTRVTEENCAVDTVTDLWKTAGWLEREVWDFYGVSFRGHSDLRRILLYQEFVGHPLRKDYPIDKHQPLARRAHVD